MVLALRYAARSDIGLGRYVNNQDSGYAGPHLLVVCDGMGGHAAGDVASSLALGRLVALDGESHGSDALGLLEHAVREANAELLHRVEQEPSLQGMGTTTTALILHGERIALAHIGDSRCYLLREGLLTRLTHDHTFVQTLVDSGKITAEEAEQHPQRSVITRVLTGDPHDEPDLSVRETQEGDRYVVCSDGLTSVVSDETLAEALAEFDEPAACADALVGLALRGGGADNITCVVAHVVDPARVDAGSVPEVVGAAAVHGTVPTVAIASTPAAKAAALDRPDDPAPDEDVAPRVGPPASKKRWAMRGLATLIVLGLLGGSGYAAYGWSQRQYYVGADGERVAIYRGLPQDIGPLRMSEVFEPQDVLLAALPPFSAERVRANITVDGLSAARSKVIELRDQICPIPEPVPPATETSTPTPRTTTRKPTTSRPTTRKPTSEPTTTTKTTTTSPTKTTAPDPADDCGDLP